MIQDHERKIIRLETKVEFLETNQQRLMDELAIYQGAVIGQNKKIDAVLHAIVGDDTVKGKGLLQRIEGIEQVTDMVKEWKWKMAGGGVVIGAVSGLAYWILQQVFK